MVGCAKMGMHFTACAPKGLPRCAARRRRPSRRRRRDARLHLRMQGANVISSGSPWANPRASGPSALPRLTVSGQPALRPNPNAIFMHCLLNTARHRQRCTRFGREAMETMKKSVVGGRKPHAHHQGRHGGDACGDRAMKRYLFAGGQNAIASGMILLENGDVRRTVRHGRAGVHHRHERLRDGRFCCRRSRNYGIIPRFARLVRARAVPNAVEPGATHFESQQHPRHRTRILREV